MKLKKTLKLFVPSNLQREIKLNQIRLSIFNKKRGGDNLNSVLISKNALLDKTTEIAEGVFVGDYACIGRHTYVQRDSEILAAKIGNFCSIGSNCHIGMFEHPIENLSTSSRLYLRILHKNTFYNDIPKPVQIGNDVWVGSNATILGGVKIGDGAVIGAGAVVTKDIPPYAVAVGVPAKIIKYRFSEEKIERLLNIQWWNQSDEELIKNDKMFELGYDEIPE